MTKENNKIKRTTRKTHIKSISMQEEITHCRSMVKLQRAKVNKLIDKAIADEKHEDGILSQFTNTSTHFMEIHTQTLDSIARLNKFVSKMKYTNKNLLDTLTQLMDNTAFAIYNHEQLLRTVSQHISNVRKDSAHNGKHITQNGKDIVHGENGSAYAGNGVAHANGNQDKQNRKLIKN